MSDTSLPVGLLVLMCLSFSGYTCMSAFYVYACQHVLVTCDCLLRTSMSNNFYVSVSVSANFYVCACQLLCLCLLTSMSVLPSWQLLRLCLPTSTSVSGSFYACMCQLRLCLSTDASVSVNYVCVCQLLRTSGSVNCLRLCFSASISVLSYYCQLL